MRPEHGLVVGKFAPPHLGHDLLIQTALEGCEQLTIVVYSNPDFELMCSRVRAEWLRMLYPNAQIYLPENPPPNDADDFTQREFVRRWLERQGLTVEVVFTSESYGPGFAEHLGVPHVLVDLERLKFPVSGTGGSTQLEALRLSCTFSLEPEGRWNWPESERLPLRPEIRAEVLRWLEPVHRVVFLGAESTGKSTLTRRMAQHYGTLSVAEYGREVWEQKSGILEPDDYTEIARRHLALEDAATLELSARARNSSPHYLFCDTNALTTLHFAYYYHRTAPRELWDLAARVESRYHHVLVCHDDLPFEQDGTRDSELTRSRMQGLILYDLERRGIRYSVVSGSLEARVQQVQNVLDSSIQPHFSS